MYLGLNWVLLMLPQLWNHPTWLPMPSSGQSRCNWCYRIENTSLFAFRCFYLWQMGNSTGKLKIYTINGSKYCAKKEWKTMIIAPRRHQHPSSGSYRPLDIAATANFYAEFNLIVVNPIIECLSRDHVLQFCQGLESSVVYTASTFFAESLHDRSNRSLRRLLLHMHAEEIHQQIVK